MLDAGDLRWRHDLPKSRSYNLPNSRSRLVRDTMIR
jgi:hypothetical protein